MSTPCQIGFYSSTDRALNAPEGLIYRHADGYPDTEHGVIATLLPWAQDFATRRGLSDVEYATARGLVALIRQAGMLDDTLGYGVCYDHDLHGDIDFYYRVDPSGITVYRCSWDVAGEDQWAKLVSDTFYPLAPA